MTPLLRKRASLATALVAAAAFSGLVAGAPAQAAPVTAAYTCGSPSLQGSLNINFSVEVTPAKVYIGRTSTPKLTLKAKIPGNIVALAAFFGVKSASATGTFSVAINGTQSPRPFTFPRSDIPQSAQDFPVTIVMGLPAVTRSSAATVTYKTGPVVITLVGYKNKVADATPGDDVGSVGATCTPKSTTQTLGTVTFVKSPTKLTASTTYAKAAKKVTAAVQVVSKSGIAPTGKITAVLYKGSKKVATRTATLAGGAATATYGGVHKKGSYKVVFSYGGSSALKGSSATRSFTVS